LAIKNSLKQYFDKIESIKNLLSGNIVNSVYIRQIIYQAEEENNSLPDGLARFSELIHRKTSYHGISEWPKTHNVVAYKRMQTY
jgi:hypothetical protein